MVVFVSADTWSFSIGIVVPIPSLPVDDTLTLSDPPVNILRSSVTAPICTLLVVLSSLNKITDPAEVLSNNATLSLNVCTWSLELPLGLSVPIPTLDSKCELPLNVDKPVTIKSLVVVSPVTPKVAIVAIPVTFKLFTVVSSTPILSVPIIS